MKYHWARKTIIVDYDGVLVDFTQAFDLYMFDKGHFVEDLRPYDVGYRYDCDPSVAYTEMHNFVHSPDFKHMPPMPKAKKSIASLRNDGYVFHCITAAPAERLQDRINSAEEIYGKNIFQRIHCIGLNSCKKKYLEKYEGSGCFWVEDKPANAVIGLDYGLTPVIMHHSYNADFYHKDVIRVKDWQELYQLIKEREIEDEF